MNVRTMRNVDRYLGVPLCWVTGIWNLLFRRNKSEPLPIESILVIKFFGMGSILLSSPFLAQLREQFPSARIFYLSFSSNKEILQRLPYGLNILSISSDSALGFARDILSVIRLLRRESISVVCDLEFFSKFSTLLSFFSGAPRRIGYELPTFWRRTNLTHSIRIDRSQHVTQVFLRQLEGLNMDVPKTFMLARLQADQSEQLSMQRKLSLGENGFEAIAVNVNAGPTSLERRWEGDRFMEVVRKLSNENRTRRFFFIGNEQDRSYVSALFKSHSDLTEKVSNCAGQLTLGELIALLQRASFLLTNDSGPMHIASAVGTDVVALFGPESPQFYGPLGNSRLVYKGIKCSPCLNIYNAKLFQCPYDARCMKELSVDEVLAAIQSLQKKPHAALA